MNWMKSVIPAIHEEGMIFIIIAIAIAALFSFFSSIMTAITLMITVFIIFFFRDPVRVTTVGDNYIVSPADGLITKIEDAQMPTSLGYKEGEKGLRVSVFLSVFDVHVNRVPANGKILDTHYHHGKFLNAALDKASIHNERQEVLMELKNGQKVVFTQIAGLIARRIVCHLQKDQEVKSGERFGIIRFGSRMDVFLPKDVYPQVFVGQKVVGGETIIADITEKSPRVGEVR